MVKLWSLQGLSWRELAKRTCRKSWDDDVFGQSARLAFYFFFALFPLLLALLIVLGKATVTGSGWRETLIGVLGQVLPSGASTLVQRTVAELNGRAGAGKGAILAGAAAAWGTLNGTWSIISGLNKAYEVKENRSPWRVLFITSGLTIFLSALGLMALAAIRFITAILARHLRQAAGLADVRHSMQWAVILPVLFLSFAMLYRFGPNLKYRRWQWSLPGALIATASWIVLVLLLSVYKGHSHVSQRIYGDLNAVATLLLWLYVTGAAIFIGGEANSEIAKAATEAGHPGVRHAGEKRSGEETCGKSGPEFGSL